MNLKVIRATNSPTFGIMLVDGMPVFVTLELPWMNNEPQISCIPTGSYTCRKRKASESITAGIGEAFEVVDVPNRSDILIHVGNTVDDIKGCILIGEKFGMIDWKPAILGSRSSYQKFLTLTKGLKELSLEIR